MLGIETFGILEMNLILGEGTVKTGVRGIAWTGDHRL